MVGRLVEQQQIGLGDENFRQRQTRALPAAELLDVRLPHRLLQPDAQQRGFETVAEGVSAEVVELVLRVFVLLQHGLERGAFHLGHLVLELAHVVGDLVQVGERQLGLVDDGVGRVEHDVLL